MNIDWASLILCSVIGAVYGLIVGMQQNAIRRLRARLGEAIALLEESNQANEALLHLATRLAAELAREQSDDWWKGD